MSQAENRQQTLLTVEEVADDIGVSRWLVEERCRRGALEHLDFGGEIRFDGELLEAARAQLTRPGRHRATDFRPGGGIGRQRQWDGR